VPARHPAVRRGKSLWRPARELSGGSGAASSIKPIKSRMTGAAIRYRENLIFKALLSGAS
jgi:hypothetical protein